MSLSLLSFDKNCNALPFPHFPASFQAVIWRNWEMIPVERLARILQCTVEDLLEAAAQLGLPEPDESHCLLWLERGYQTIIRQNWHLLSIEQIQEALGWDLARLEYILKEDDFLWNKLGKCKPHAELVKYRELMPDELSKTKQLKSLYLECRKKLIPATAGPFDFLKTSAVRKQTIAKKNDSLRMIYSYSALYGDPLLEGIDKIYPDKLLDEYAANGINALWMQAVLYTLIPWFGETALSEKCQIRMKNLRKLAQRMSVRGIRLFLYLNEPRALPAGVFESCCPEWRGASQRLGLYSPCTSLPEVRDALSNAIEELFSSIPELGGFFAITMSENPTNCWSHTLFAPPTNCERCFSRGQAPVIAELINSMAHGAWRGNPKAEVIAWNWGWEKEWDEQVVEQLDTRVKLMCVSETGLETEACGIKGTVWDYSMSKVGPGAWAERLWKKARDRGQDIMAKVQLNNSWECSAVPYLPTPGLVEKHLNNLRELGVNDFMLSWTLGGYPGGNLRLLSNTKEELAQEDFGAAAEMVLEACDCFDKAFSCFPFNMVDQIYLAPQNFGPLNQLHMTPTGNRATMLGFPYDDLHRWTGNGHYPEEVFEEQYRKISETWEAGLKKLEEAGEIIPADRRERYADLSSVAEAVYCHFRSSYLQIAFIRRRSKGLYAVRALLEEEIDVATRLLNIVRRDSRIGFEASNHYYYTENTLMEKVFNCHYLLKHAEIAHHHKEQSRECV
jgi:hypothetical protein